MCVLVLFPSFHFCHLSFSPSYPSIHPSMYGVLCMFAADKEREGPSSSSPLQCRRFFSFLSLRQNLFMCVSLSLSVSLCLILPLSHPHLSILPFSSLSVSLSFPLFSCRAKPSLFIQYRLCLDVLAPRLSSSRIAMMIIASIIIKDGNDDDAI